MSGKKVKFTFFILGIISIFLCGISWWFTKTFGEIHILQILWHAENAHALTGFDDDIIRHFIQFICLCCIISAVWFFILYKRHYIYI